MKTLLSISLLLLTIIVSAQKTEGVEALTKGTKFVGGTLFFNYDESIDKNDDYKNINTGISLGPLAGKYIKDNVALGLWVSYGFSSNKNEYPDDTEYKNSNHFIGVGSFIRKNYKIVPNLFFFLQGQASLSYGASKTIDTSDSETKFNNYSFSLGAAPGLQLFLNKKISLETTLGYIGYRFAHQKNTDSDDKGSNTNSIDLGGGLGSVNFSIRYFIHP